GSLSDLLAAHGRQLVDLLAELGAVGVEPRELIDELADALIELTRLFRLERNQAGSLCRCNRLKHLRRVELQLGRSAGRGVRLGCRGHAQSFLAPSDARREAGQRQGSRTVL